MSTADDLLKDVLVAHDEPWNLDMKLVIGEIRAYLADKNPSTSISSEEVDKSTQKRLAIQNAKPPLNGDQILEGFKELGLAHYDYRIRCFTEGVRFAERMRDE